MKPDAKAPTPEAAGGSFSVVGESSRVLGSRPHYPTPGFGPIVRAEAMADVLNENVLTDRSADGSPSNDSESDGDWFIRAAAHAPKTALDGGFAVGRRLSGGAS